LRKLGIASAVLAALVLTSAADAGAAKRSAEEPGLVDVVTELLPAATQESCESPALENPFGFLGDLLDYTLAPDGSFETGGWLLEGPASITDGNDPFPVRSADVEDDSVLTLAADGSATSAPMCVDLDYPHFRIALNQLARDDGKLRGRLRVETLYPEAKNPRWRKVDVIRPGESGWRISDFLDLEPERGGPDPGAREVSLRFTAINGGGFQIDEVYVDPRSRI